ncbi:flavodoxin [Desulfoluna limicola]|uniref:Flavodoxin n=1 Tax=Desulfoluna limicola TaxID=2810562 RepID=A0ABM7PDG0_9BACT|nr:flavin reductase family protein [Desulfoluna limicola]BCS95246.1 flavodoxin [Desulfoluna limicola]
MHHKHTGGANLLYPSLTTIVGAVLDGKPNWMAIAHVGIMNHGGKDVPHYISISCHPSHHTNEGIREHGEFSVNIPGRSLMEKADYVGIVSGKTRDKSGLFDTFQGTLNHAPMIKECPVTMECRVAQKVIVGEHEVFIGEIVGSYVAEECFENGKPDLKKVDPILFDFTRIRYWSLGEYIGDPWRTGKSLKS